MNIEKLKVFLKEWKEDRVNNGNCEMYSRDNGKKCIDCTYNNDVLEVENFNEDLELFTICELLGKIESVVDAE